MAEPRRTEAKNFHQDRPGGYFTPKGIDRQAERHDRDALAEHVKLLGDTVLGGQRRAQRVRGGGGDGLLVLLAPSCSSLPRHKT